MGYLGRDVEFFPKVYVGNWYTCRERFVMCKERCRIFLLNMWVAVTPVGMRCVICEGGMCEGEMWDLPSEYVGVCDTCMDQYHLIKVMTILVSGILGH